MKTFCTVLSLILVANTLPAQDSIYLKNRKIIAGRILSSQDDEVLIRKAVKSDSVTYSYAKRDIAYMQQMDGSFTSFERPVWRPNGTVVSNQLKFSGPRIGFTMIGNGSAADYIRDDLHKTPFISQFGWQLETRMFTFPNGTSGLAEFVPLIGGIEQGMFLPSMNFLVGLRGKSGFEFAFGPNLSLTGTAMVIAVGTSIKRDEIYFPITLAVVPSVRVDTGDGWEKSGTRIGLTFGFNSQKP